MATLADLMTDLDTALATLTSGTKVTSQLRTDLSVANGGAVLFQRVPVLLPLSLTDTPGSNDGPWGASVRILIHVPLDSEAEEETALEVSQYTWFSSLYTPSWWTAFASVDRFMSVPDTVDISREGQVVTFEADAFVVILA